MMERGWIQDDGKSKREKEEEERKEKAKTDLPRNSL